MASSKPRTSSFSRNLSSASTPPIPGLKHGPNGTMFLSSGIEDLDKILGGGFTLGSLVMVMEDPDAPHHMLLLRNFMSQGLIHTQPLLYASPAKDPKGFLGTLPNPLTSKDDKSHVRETEQEKALRIAWQYKKYFGEQNLNSRRDGKAEYCNDFDLRKPLERHILTGQSIDCVSFHECSNVASLHDRCSTFLAQNHRSDGGITCGGRIAIQSLCTPQCDFSNKDWEMLSFIRSLKPILRSSNAVAIVTFPPSLLSSHFLKRWQHLADTLISVKTIPDEDKELSKLLTGYQDMIGLLNIHKVVPANLESTIYSMKLFKRRSLILECLNQAPVDGSSGSSYASSGSCGSNKSAGLDF